MKKIITTLLFSLTFLPINAQQHLKFIGIPLNGTINQFQAKLSSKGIIADKELNKIIPVGTRSFKGTFCGKDAEIYVYYDQKSKIVYRAKAVITAYDKNTNKDNYYYFYNNISEKYPTANVKNDLDDDGNMQTTYFIYDNHYDDMGTIDLYRTNSYNYKFYLHIDYTDEINSTKYENNIIDDL